MKRINIISLTLTLALMLPMVASAQWVNTASGVRHESVNALRQQTDAHMAQVAARAFYSSEGMGGGLTFTKIHNANKAVGFGWGVNAGVAYNKNIGSLVDVAVKPTVKLGRSAQLRISGLVGLGETLYKEFSQQINGNGWNEYHNSVWSLKAGGEGALFIPFSKYVGMEIFGGYQHSFADPEERGIQSAEGWSCSADYHLNSWYAGLGLVFNLNNHQVYGNNCWIAGVYGGYSFAPSNEGVVIGVEAINAKKAGKLTERILGFGIDNVFGEVTTNSVYGKGGINIFPNGDKSVVFFTTAAKVGVGEYYKVDKGQTTTGSFELYSSYFALGVKASAEVGIGLKFDRFKIAAIGEFGGHLVGDTKFESVGDVDYTGNVKTKLSGYDGQIKVQLSFALLKK